MKYALKDCLDGRIVAHEGGPVMAGRQAAALAREGMRVLVYPADGDMRTGRLFTPETVRGRRKYRLFCPGCGEMVRFPGRARCHACHWTARRSQTAARESARE